MVADHRGADALAKLGEVGAQLHVPQPGRGQLLLHGGHRHHPLMGVVEMCARLVGLHPAGALQQHAGDDLEAVGHAVLQLLQQDRLLAQQVVPELLAEARVGDVRHGQEQTDVLCVGIGQAAGVHDQAARLLARAHEIHLVGIDRTVAVQGRLQQRSELRHVPFAPAELEQRTVAGAGLIDLERSAERDARGQDDELAVHQQKRRV